MNVRLTQLDGKLPNLALMKLAAFHRARGDEIRFTRSVHRHLDEPQYERVYGSAIFKFSADRLARFRAEFPDAIVGGTGTDSPITVEQIVGDFDGYDYTDYPTFTGSLGFTQRGCRFKCGFCVVPKKEGDPKVVGSLADIWRGPPHPKHIHLLDNDFFGQPKPAWKARLQEAREGGFKLCFNQGINVRVITDEIAEELASVQYRDDQFKERRIYTAWDNVGDEKLFFRGVDRLESKGIPPKHLLVFMLVGFDPDETWERIHYRFNRMAERGVLPYPMVFDVRATDPEHYRALKRFQRWAATGLYRAVPFSDYDPSRKAPHPDAANQLDMFAGAA